MFFDTLSPDQRDKVKSPTDFPDSFHFFSYMCSHPPSLQYLSWIIFFFMNLQMFISAFTPFIIAARVRGDKVSTLGSIYSVTLYFSSSDCLFEIRNGAISFSVLLVTVVIFFQILYTLISFYFFNNFNLKARYFLMPFRTLLFCPFQLVGLYPCILNFAELLGGIMRNQMQIDYLNFFLLALFISIVVAYTKWISPIYFSTPIINDSWMPSSIIPNESYCEMQNNTLIILGLTIAISGNFSIYFFTPFIIIISTYRMYAVFSRPFVYAIDNSLSITISLHMIIFSIISAVANSYEKVYSEMMTIFYVSIVFFFIVFFVFTYLFSKSGFIDKLGTFARIQFAINENSVTVSQIAELQTEFERTNDIDYLLSFIYIKIITGDVDKDIAHNIIELTQRSFNYVKQFIVFELYKYLCSISESVVSIPKIDEFLNSLQEFNFESDNFWMNMITGDINKAFAVSENCAKKMRENVKRFYYYYTFFPHHKKIDFIKKDFLYLSHVGGKSVSLFDRFQTRGNKINIVDPIFRPWGGSNVLFGVTTTNSFQSDDEQEEHQMNKVRDNIRRFANKPIPSIFVVFIVVSLILILTVCVYLSIPFRNIDSHVYFLKYLPEIVSRSAQIGIDWGYFDCLMNALINCTDLIQLRCDQILSYFGGSAPEPPEISCISISDLADNVSSIVRSIQTNTQKIHSDLSSITNRSFYSQISKKWMSPNIYAYADVPGLESYQMDSVSLLLRYMSMIHKREMYTEPISSSNMCNSTALNGFRKHHDQFCRNSWSIFDNILNSISDSDRHIVELSQSNSVNFSTFNLAIKSLTFPVFFIVICLLYFACKVELSNLMKKYMRPETHPNPDIHVTFIDSTKRFRCSGSFFLVFLLLLLLYSVYTMHLVLIWKEVRNLYGRILNFCKIIDSIGHYSIRASKLFSSFIRMRYISDDEIIHNDLLVVYSEMMESYIELGAILAEVSSTDSVRYAMSDFCDENDKIKVRSMHDIYRCWSIQKSLAYFSYAMQQHMEGNTSIHFQIISHYYLSHLMPILKNFTVNLVTTTTMQSDILSFLTFVETALAALFGTVYCLIVFWLFIELVDRFNIMISLFINLQPIFIAKSRAMTGFLIDVPKENDSTKDTSDFLKIFDKTNISLLVLSSDLNIMACTKPLLTVFGYRKEQLIGQYVEILIPKSSKETEKNDTKFYQQMNILREMKNALTFTRWMVGRCSDNSSIHLRTIVSMTRFHKKKYFVLEFKPMSDELNYEDLIISHSELFGEFSKASMPVSLFSSEISSFPEKRTFQNSIFVYVGYGFVDEQLSTYNDFEKLKNVHEFALPFFSGIDGAIIIDCTCSYCVVLFVNDKNDDKHIVNAIRFVSGFSQANPYETIGAIYTVGKTQVVMFPPPLLKEGEKIEDSNSGAPMMTIEPLASTISLLPKLFAFFKNRCIIISNDLIEYFADSDVESVGNNCDLHISLVTIEIDEFDNFNYEL